MNPNDALNCPRCERRCLMAYGNPPLVVFRCLMCPGTVSSASRNASDMRRVARIRRANPGAEVCA